MPVKIKVLSKEKVLTQYLIDYLRNKGCEVELSKSERAVSGGTEYLVVINIDNEWGSKLSERIAKYLPKVVIVNSAKDPGLYATTPVKQIFVDNVFPTASSKLKEVYEKGSFPRVFLPAHAWVAVVNIEDLMDKIAQELFSFRADKKTLLGKLISYHEIVSFINPSVQISIDVNALHRLPRRGLVPDETRFDLSTLKFLAETKVATRIKKNKPIELKKYKKPTALFLVASLVLALFPYFLFAVSGIGGASAYRFFKSGQLQNASKAILVAGAASKISSRMLSFASLPMYEAAGLLVKATGVGGRVLSVTSYASNFSANVLEGKNIEELAENLYLELSALYRDLSFLESEPLAGLPFASSIAELQDISVYRKYVLAAAKLVRELPNLLGYDRPKTYMVLLQNNMELRPTGGFIGSFALVTFSKGELIDNTIYDVYTADGQLKGYVVPPRPIEEHLGEASWTLRDSNWDPDFPTSAARAEWFLDKSLDRDVDGVIAVNLEVARKYLEVLGPIELSDFGDKIDAKNMYEKVQHEVENDFFPGSRKKAHYLSSLMSAIITRLEAASFEQSMEILFATVGTFMSRDIQIYMHEPSVQNIFSEQDWAGTVEVPICTNSNCGSVFLGVVEANLGVNKANYHVARAAKLILKAQNGIVEHELVLTLKNTAPGQDRIPEQRYKAYIRALVPTGSQFLEAYEYDGEKHFKDVDIEELKSRGEYGVLVEVLPGEQKNLVYKWRAPIGSDFNKDGELDVFWWKQSGVGEYPLTIELNMPRVASIKSTPPAALTKDGNYIYNTTLSKDFKASIIWKSQ